MTAYDPAAWDSFFVGGAGAAAALAGLLFVGISISLPTIAASDRLVRRALEAFLLLVVVLLVSMIGLIPDGDRVAIGAAFLVVTGSTWAAVTTVHVRVVRARAADRASGVPRVSVPAQIVLGQAALVPFVVGSLSFLLERGGGLDWIGAAIPLAFLAALTDAWVLLVEIQR